MINIKQHHQTGCNIAVWFFFFFLFMASPFQGLSSSFGHHHFGRGKHISEANIFLITFFLMRYMQVPNYF